ncbi:HAD family hydrolase [Promicromonospora sp. NPDC057138]|uniref:HAD family hydrolase n=1 Tax=Promicromonospora sp. NPDC057138 TaxID=3346031 RepID=UPI00363C7A0F
MTTPDNVHIASPRLIALDIDGTLLHANGHISDVVHEAIDQAQAAGHHLVLATGRGLDGLLSIAERLALINGFAVGANGGLTIRLDPAAPDGYRFANARMFDPATVIHAAVSLVPDVLVGVEELVRGWKVNRNFGPKRLNGEQKQAAMVDLSAGPSCRVALSAPGIQQHLEALRATGVTVTPAGPDWLDVTGPGVSKATTLERLRTKLGVAIEHTVAIGDGPNDIEALTWAGRGVAMGHAAEAVREAADEVTGTIDEDGAATVLTSLVRQRVEGPADQPTERSARQRLDPGRRRLVARRDQASQREIPRSA